MLNGEGCQELNQLCDLAASQDIAVLKDVPEDVYRLAGRIVQKWWKLANKMTILVGGSRQWF
jgi:hypothetical protein